MICAVVLAGGSGQRFGQPKQFLELAHGQRLVDQAVSTVRAVADNVIVVLPPQTTWDGVPVDAVAAAGDDRLGSVRNALAVVPARSQVILVHDAAHPLATPSLARAVVAEVLAGADAAFPFLGLVDVLKRKHASGQVATLGREGLGLCQVPQAFSAKALRAVHAGQIPYGDACEDSELIERAGGKVVTVTGEAANIHVVDAADLWVVRTIRQDYESYASLFRRD